MDASLDGITTSDSLSSKISALGTWRSMEQPTESKLCSIAWQIDPALNDKNSEQDVIILVPTTIATTHPLLDDTRNRDRIETGVWRYEQEWEQEMEVKVETG